MADSPTPNSDIATTATTTAAPPVAAANPNPSLLATPPAGDTTKTAEMPAGFEGGAEAWGKLDDAGKTAAAAAATEKATADSKARGEAFAKAEGKDAKLAAWNALTQQEKVAAYKDLPDAVKTELGLADPSRPTYQAFKLPDGVTLDETQMKAATDLFADSGLNQETAQKFIDLALSREQAAAERGAKTFVEMQNKWTGEVKADPEIGGDKLDASLASAARAIDRLNVPGLKEALNLTGAGNHPAVVKAFVRFGQMLSEDRFQPGRDAAPAAPRSPADVIYGSGPKQSPDA